MKLQVWESVIVSWINALNLPPVNSIQDLKKDNFLLNILDKLHYKGGKLFEDDYSLSNDPNAIIFSFIKDIYPDYEVPSDLNSTENITLVASLILLWFCLKTKDKDVLSPLYSLVHSTQCCIQTFLEKLLYIPFSSITKDLIVTAIVSIDESFTVNEPVVYASFSSPSVHVSKPEIFMSPLLDRNKEEIKSLRRDVELLRSENSYLVGEMDQFKSDMEKHENDILLKNKEILRLENELFAARSHETDNPKEKRRSGGSREKKLKNEIDGLEKLIVSLKQENNSLTDSKTHMKRKIGKLEEDNAGWKEKALEMEDKCNILELQVNQNEAVISQLHQTIQEQKEFLSETQPPGNSVGNDSSLLVMCDDICSIPENLTSVIEVKYNELEANYQLLIADLSKTKLALQDKDKRIYSLMAEINTNSYEISKLMEQLNVNKNSLVSKCSLITQLETDKDNFEKNYSLLELENKSFLGKIDLLQTQLSKENERNTDFKNQVKSLLSEIDQNTKDFKMKEEEIRSLEVKLNKKHDRLKESKENINQLKKQITWSATEINNLETKIQKLDELYKQTCSKLNTETSLREQIEMEMNSMKTELEKQISSQNTQLEMLTNSLNILENEKETHLFEIKRLTELCELNKTTLKNKNDELVGVKSKFSSMQLDIDSYKVNTENLLAEKNNFVLNLKELKEVNENLQQQLTNSNETINMYKNQVEELVKEANGYLEEKQTLTSRLQDFDNNLLTITDLQSEIVNLNEFISFDKIQIKKITEEKNKLNESLLVKQREIESLTYQLIECKKCLESEFFKYQELEDKYNKLTESNETLLAELVAQRKRVTELDAENLEHVYELSNLRESKEKLNVKMKEQFDAFSLQVDTLKSLNSKMDVEKNELKSSKNQMEEKLNLIIESEGENLKKIMDENKCLTDRIDSEKKLVDEMNFIISEQTSKISALGVEMERTVKENKALNSELTQLHHNKLQTEEEISSLLQANKDYEKTLHLKSSEYQLLKSKCDQLKTIISKHELEIEELLKEKNAAKTNEIALNEKLQDLNTELQSKLKLLDTCERKISDINLQLDKDRAVINDLLSENQVTTDKQLNLVSENDELQKCLQEKSETILDLANNITTLKSNETKYLGLKAENESLNEKLEFFTSKTDSLTSELNSLNKVVANTKSANKGLLEELTSVKDQFVVKESKIKELSDRVETLNNLMMEYCITIQENTTYISELKGKMTTLKESLATKDNEIFELVREKKSSALKLNDMVRNDAKLNSNISSLKNTINDQSLKILEYEKCMSDLECSKNDIFNERDQLSQLVNSYYNEINRVNSKLLSTKKTLYQTQDQVSTLLNDIAEKNDVINKLNSDISGFKYGLVENSNLLKQILNETRFFGEASMMLLGDIRQDCSLGVDDFEVNEAESPFDPASEKWRDLQCKIIMALKVQLDSVYSAAKEKDTLCNDLNLKINDLLSEKRQETLETEKFRSQTLELKKQIDELAESTKKLLIEKDEAISALKEEMSFISDSESKEAAELRLKIEKLLEFNSELEFKLNQAQLERDFFREETELLVSLQNEIKEKDANMLKLEQDIEMLEHEKNILNKRVTFLTKDAEDVKSLKIELSDIKHKFSIMDGEQQCGDTEHLTDEEKLTRIKPEFLKNDLRTCFEEAIEQIIQQCDRKLHCYKEKLDKSEVHIKELSTDLWEAHDKYLISNQELHTLRAELAKALSANTKQESRLSLEGALHRLSFGCIGTGFDNLGCEELEKMDDVFPLNYQQRQLRNSKKQRRHSGLPKFSLMSGRVFPTEEEVEEIFNDNCLSDLKSGICSLPDPKARYLSLPPSNFPYKDTEDRRLSCSRSLQGLDKPKKEVGQIIYRKPGPPTPSKNGTRLSLSDGNCLPSTSGIREQNSNKGDENVPTPTTNKKIKTLFTAKAKQPPTQTQEVVKKKTGFFRRKKERENISPA